MEKILTGIILLYALFVAVYLTWLRAGRIRKKHIIGRSGSYPEGKRLKSDIVGKSRFKLSSSMPLAANAKPLDSSLSEPGNAIEKAGNFALPDEGKPIAEVPPDELDEVFSDTPSGEENEPMEIDYPLEYETAPPEDCDEEETEEMEGLAGAMLATGVRFEDLGNVVRTLNRTEDATPRQRQKAGDTLLEIRRSDLFEQLVSGKPDAKRMVTELMAESLATFYERKDREAGISGDLKKVPDDFNIRDFI